MLNKILKFIFKIIAEFGYAIYLAIALSFLGHGPRTHEFWIVIIPTIILVGLKFFRAFKELELIKRKVQCLKEIIENEMNGEVKWKE